MRTYSSISTLVLAIVTLPFALTARPAAAVPAHGHAHKQTHAAGGASATGKSAGKAAVKTSGKARTKRAASSRVRVRGANTIAARRAESQGKTKQAKLARGKSAAVAAPQLTPATLNTAVPRASLHPAVAIRRVGRNDRAYFGRAYLARWMPAPLFGSHESLVHQNEMAEAEGLERILDDSDLNERIANGSLVQLPVTAGLGVNPSLPENRRYCRPWTAKFLKDLAKAHSAHYGSSSIEVTSAVRTVEYQRELRTFNGNAAAADGDIASPHLTGGTIDIAKAGLTRAEIGWLRSYLIPLEQAGKIDVEEEFRQSCFHISVYKSYLGGPPAPMKLPEPAIPSSLAAGSILTGQGR